MQSSLVWTWYWNRLSRLAVPACVLFSAAMTALAFSSGALAQSSPPPDCPFVDPEMCDSGGGGSSGTECTGNCEGQTAHCDPGQSKYCCWGVTGYICQCGIIKPPGCE